jgi:ADP-ribose pyrophosphatase YjhB (NUDIX family)/Txe/YoeB family toxin of Txe-Axe toxin-antitoxin module
MPQAVSRRQFRLMQAILHGKVDASKSSGRGTPPKSVAAKYSSPGKDAPEQHGEDRGGSWSDKHHAKAKEKVKEARKERKKSKKELKKSFEDHYSGHAAAALVMNDNNQILLGRHSTGGMAFAGGHMDMADGDKAVTALRELKEEMGIQGRNPQKVWSGKLNGNECDVFLIESFTGEPKSTDELKNPRWFDAEDIPWDDMRDCCYKPLEEFIRTKLGKSLQGMMSLEKLEKNVVRSRGDAVLEVTHGDALRLVGNGMFRKLREEVKDMKDEDFKDIHLDTYKISIRKHMNDIYSGRVDDGHKMVYQWTHKSLPELTAALMSVFEWYLPEDEEFMRDLHDDSIEDDVLHGGVQTLVENYKRHNIGEIYQEMETIREQIRNGAAIDLQQVEARIMKLFDKLEETIHTVSDKHNQLAELAGKEIDELEAKLRALQSKIDDMGKGPETVTAYSSVRTNPARIHDENYPYLPRPQVEISPDGRIKITFASDWTDLEKQNFLHDMRAKAVKREKLNG